MGHRRRVDLSLVSTVNSCQAQPDERCKYLLYTSTRLLYYDTTTDEWVRTFTVMMLCLCSRHRRTRRMQQSSRLTPLFSPSSLFHSSRGRIMCVPRFRLLCDDATRRCSGLSTIKLTPTQQPWILTTHIARCAYARPTYMTCTCHVRASKMQNL